MFALVNPFLQICILRMRPQDLPQSPFLLWLTMGAYTLTSIVALSVLRLPLRDALLAGLLATALLAGLTLSLLYAMRLSERIYQTLSALAGSSALLNFIATLFAIAVRPPGEDFSLSGAAAFAFSVLMLWSFVITAHVLRHALSASFFLGLALAIVFNLVSDQVLAWVFDFEVTTQ